MKKLLAQLIKESTSQLFPQIFIVLKKIFKLASQFNRKILLRGRSIGKYLDTAIQIGILSEQEVEDRLLNDRRDRIPENAIFLVAGCQGDRKSSLSNLVNSPGSKFFPRKGDTFIFSSKTIPGNEGKVNYIIDELYRYDINVLNDRDGFHTSRHVLTKKTSLKYMKNITQLTQSPFMEA